MQLNETLAYDAAPDAVFTMLCDPAWREHVCELAHAQAYNVNVERNGESATITVQRTMRAELPDAVKSLLGKTIEVRQVEKWGPPDAAGTRRAELTVQIKGQPASMEGTSLLRGSDTSTLTVDGDVRVKVPIIGRKFEPEVAKAIRSALRIEEKAAADYLSRHR